MSLLVKINKWNEQFGSVVLMHQCELGSHTFRKTAKTSDHLFQNKTLIYGFWVLKSLQKYNKTGVYTLWKHVFRSTFNLGMVWGIPYQRIPETRNELLGIYNLESSFKFTALLFFYRCSHVLRFYYEGALPAISSFPASDLTKPLHRRALLFCVGCQSLPICSHCCWARTSTGKVGNGTGPVR